MPATDPLLLLHLSDLHFGDKSRFASSTPEQLGETCAADIERTREELDIKPTVGAKVVLVSGDIAQFAKPKEYELASRFLRALGAKLKVEPRCFVFCPGNHDVSWSECKKVVLDQDTEGFGDEELRHRMDAAKLKFYKEFLQSWYGKGIDRVASQPLGCDGWLHSFPDLRLSVAALNSCERESHREPDHVGKIGVDQLKALLKAWRESVEKDWLKVAMFHHHPNPPVRENIDHARKKLREELEKDGALTQEIVDRYVSDLTGFDGADELENLVWNTHTQLVLHGHQHAGDLKSWPWDGDGSALVISAGSAFGSAKEKPADHPNSLRLIFLDTPRSRLRGCALVFDPRQLSEDRVSTGAFVRGTGKGDEIKERRLPLPDRFEVTTRIAAVPPPTPDDEPVLTRYLEEVIAKTSRIDIRGIATAPGATAAATYYAIEELYTPLRSVAPARDEELDLRVGAGRVELPGLLSERRLLLVGNPGGGKTTFLRLIACVLAKDILGKTLDGRARHLGLSLDDEAPLPILVRLASLAEWMAKDRAGKEGFPDRWLVRYLAECYDEATAIAIGRQLDAGRCALLLDGLDEMPEPGLRQQVIDLVGALIRRPGENLIVVTSRPHGYHAVGDVPGMTTALIDDFGEAEVDQFLGKWLRALYPDENALTRDEYGPKLRAELTRTRYIRQMARNPVMLTCWRDN